MHALEKAGMDMHFYKAVLLWLKKAGITSETLTDEVFRQAVCAVNTRWQEIGNWLIENREGADIACKAIVRHELCTSNPDAFPNVEEFDASDYFELGVDNVQTLLNRTIFAVDNKDGRPAMQCLTLTLLLTHV